MKYPNRIKELRLGSKLTQEELALLVKTDNTTVSRHESGDRVLDADIINRYARVFKCETYELFMPTAPDSED